VKIKESSVTALNPSLTITLVNINSKKHPQARRKLKEMGLMKRLCTKGNGNPQILFNK
jgi:hypothetical protein